MNSILNEFKGKTVKQVAYVHNHEILLAFDDGSILSAEAVNTPAKDTDLLVTVKCMKTRKLTSDDEI